MRRIYLDHAATTPVDKEVLRAMMPYFSDKFGNASSIHSFGQEARAAVDQARDIVAKFLNCKTGEVIFTSGGSESDNLAIKGIIHPLISSTDQALIKPMGANKLKSYSLIPHIITSAFEHHAVLDTIKELERDGVIEATYIKPNKEGIIDPADVEKAIKGNTVLVSIMYVNNEIGTVQPIREIGQLIEKVNRSRYEVSGIRQKKPNTKYDIHNTEKNLPKIFFHTDAVQAAEYFKMDVDYLHVDMLTMSAHKIYGPKGVGVLYARKGTPLKHQIVGGGQEYKMRAGTENVAGIVGMGKAIEIIQKSKIKNQKYRSNRQQGVRTKDHNSSQPIESVSNNKLMSLRDELIKGIERTVPEAILNGSRQDRSPANVNFSFMNVEGESILLNLDALGIAASSGSACTSGSLEPSHVLISMGKTPEQCHGSIRFTLGRDTTQADIDYVLKVLPGIVKKLREMSPLNNFQ